MISFSLNPEAENRAAAARLAAAMAEYESKGGQITQGECFTGKPIPPKRRDWVDPETVLKRKPGPMSLANRKRLRQLAEAV